MDTNTLFQYCQKLIILSADKKSTLLARRQGERDYNEVFTFVGGKLETTDGEIVEGLKREKDEELGTNFVVGVIPNETSNLLFRKKDGNTMVIAHIPAIHIKGEINLSDEYSEYRWIPIDEVADFEPKIKNIPEHAKWALKKLSEPGIKLVEI